MNFGYGSRAPVSARDRDGYLAVAIELAQQAGSATLLHFRADTFVHDKSSDGHFDPVTVADKAAEAIIRAGIESRYPTHGILGEEHGFKAGSGLTWVIDPIDGTRAFITGMVHWGVLIALFDGTTPVLGVMYQPFTEELFIGTNEYAEFRRGAQIRSLSVRACESVGMAVMASTGPQFLATHSEQAGFRALQHQVRFTRFGGDCYLYCMLAMGFIDLAVEAGLKPYDVQALMPIIRGAGGVITTWDGGDASMGGRIIAAGDPHIHEQAMTILANGMAGLLG
jgi:histidinol phosphatase-like enzyme (inositol monophosphatase family)